MTDPTPSPADDRDFMAAFVADLEAQHAGPRDIHRTINDNVGLTDAAAVDHYTKDATIYARSIATTASVSTGHAVVTTYLIPTSNLERAAAILKNWGKPAAVLGGLGWLFQDTIEQMRAVTEHELVDLLRAAAYYLWSTR